MSAYIRNPSWLDDHAVGVEVLTTREPRAVLRALLAMHAAGEAVTHETVAARSGIPLGVLEGMDEECWDPGVPELMRHLRRLQARRALRLLGDVLHVAAADDAADVSGTCRRVRDLLAALEEAAA